jgi:RNA polymerase sigma-70 factor (ECF subfamily)
MHVGRIWSIYHSLVNPITPTPVRVERAVPQVALRDPVQGDDPAFVAALRAGNPAAFEKLVRESGGRLLAVARRMLHQEEAAQDAVQEAYLSAFKALPKFGGESKVTTWLHRILVNVCLMRLRTQSRRPERSIEAMLPTFAEDGHFALAPSKWKETGSEAEETSDAVRAAMAELPEQYREVLVLRDVSELDTAQTAAFLGTSENNVKTRLHRARLALRQLIDEKLASEEARSKELRP